MQKQDFFNIFKGTVLGLVVVAAGVSISVYAVTTWTPPTQAPPNGNADYPLNVSSANQFKAGALGVGPNPGGMYPINTLDVNGYISMRGGNYRYFPQPGRIPVAIDTVGTMQWQLLGHHSSSWCYWAQPNLVCNVGSTWQGTSCGDKEYVAAAKPGFKHCTGNDNDITYIMVYCCVFTS